MATARYGTIANRFVHSDWASGWRARSRRDGDLTGRRVVGGHATGACWPEDCAPVQPINRFITCTAGAWRASEVDDDRWADCNAPHAVVMRDLYEWDKSKRGLCVPLLEFLLAFW